MGNKQLLWSIKQDIPKGIRSNTLTLGAVTNYTKDRGYKERLNINLYL